MIKNNVFHMAAGRLLRRTMGGATTNFYFSVLGDFVLGVTPQLAQTLRVAIDDNPRGLDKDAGNLYLGSFRDRTVTKYTLAGVRVWTHARHTASVRTVVVDDLGNVYSSSNDSTIRKTNPDGDNVWVFTGHTDQTIGLAVDRDGNVYSNSADQTIRKINAAGNEVWSYRRTGRGFALAIDGSGNIYSGSNDNQIVLKLNNDGQLISSIEAFGSGPRDLACDESGNLYSVGRGDHVEKFSADGDLLWTYDLFEDGHSIAVDPSENVYVGQINKISILNFDGTLRDVYTDATLGEVSKIVVEAGRVPVFR